MENYPVVTQKAPKNLRRKVAVMGVGGTGLLGSMMANAALDVSSLTTNITSQSSNVETIGLAILGVLIVIAGIALLRRVIH